MVLASAGIEPSGVLKYKEIVDEALILAKREKSIKTIIYQRKDVHIAKNLIEGRDYDYD